MMTYELLSVASAAHWAAYHCIRRQVLWEARGEFNYDETYGDEYLPHNHPLLLMLDHKPLGTTRLDDFQNGTGAVRLVAIAAGEQGRGHGRVLSDLVEARARLLCLHTLYVNAAPEALGYYYKLGWEKHSWDPVELEGIAFDCIQMRKLLASQQQ